MFLIRPFEISVGGWPSFTVFASSHQRAKVKAFRSYQASYNSATFKDFLKLRPSAKLIPAPDTFGKEILVDCSLSDGFETAYFIQQRGNTVTFAKPKGVELHYVHELDCKNLPISTQENEACPS